MSWVARGRGAANTSEEAAFREPLREGFAKLGYIDGRNVHFDECYAAEEPRKFDRCAAELVSHNVDALIAGSVPAALALQRATSSMPIVLVANPDPVGPKLAVSLSRPGGNINRRTADTIGVKLPASLLSRADRLLD